MRKDKNQALKLRLSGKSYTEISKALKVPKSTLSDWFTGLELSETARNRIKNRIYAGTLKGLIKRNKRQTHLAIQRTKRIRLASSKEITTLDKKELRLVGITLYWAEGYKRPIVRNGKERTNHVVSLANSDPKLISIFLRFLREICAVPEEKITANIRSYEHLKEERIIKFWQEITKLPRKNFDKVYYGISKSSEGKKPFNRLPYGTISIRVNNTNLFHKIMGWIEGLAK